jgi:hypothetical protein
MRFLSLKILAGVGSAAAALLTFSAPASALAADRLSTDVVTQTEPVSAPVTANPAPITVTTGISVPVDANPVALAISRYYTVSVEEIEALRSLGAGWGYANIVKIYAFAQAAGINPARVIQMRAGGMGWGQIAKELNLPRGAGNVRLRRVIKAVQTSQAIDVSQRVEQSGTQMCKPARKMRVKPAPRVKPEPKSRVKKPAPVRRVKPPKKRVR